MQIMLVKYILQHVVKGGGVPNCKITELFKLNVTFPKLNIPLILSKTWLLLLFITGCTMATTAHTGVDTAQKIVQG